MSVLLEISTHVKICRVRLNLDTIDVIYQRFQDAARSVDRYCSLKTAHIRNCKFQGKRTELPENDDI